MNNHKLEKTYKPKDIEVSWYKKWESGGYFKPSGEGEPFCIMIPPPNVTGSLHMGHAFQDSLIDTIVRYQRMMGKDTLWQVGTDHAGIATQMLVERKLSSEGKKKHEIGREKFIEKIWDWKNESGGMITEQLRRMGASVDWSRERFTMDEGCSAAVREVFIKLYDEGLIYRGKRLVNWDTSLQTAISDLEVVSEPEEGHLWYLRYPLVEGDQSIIVATTRPETMLGDVAVAVNPNDKRYSHHVGKNIRLPLTGRVIPIISDTFVDKDFGTGCVKITPGHDFNDFSMGQRHSLEIINILCPDGTLNTSVPKAYQGLDRFIARKKIYEDLNDLNLVEKVEPHIVKTPRGDRSGVVIEPYLTDQWFVSVKSLSEPAIKAVESGKINFVPKQWENTYFAWMNELKDWCISRQLWWGHRIPAFYDDQGNIYVARDINEAREKYNLLPSKTLVQDEDVLDTWFSSALWTFSTLGWPATTKDLTRYHPSSVLITGFDIIFFWVARMIMMTLKFTENVPFKTVYVHGLVRDSEGQKMSKSKGNVLDPIDLIDGCSLEKLIEKRTANLLQPEKRASITKATSKAYPEGLASYGTDALRFTFCSLASTGRDINFDVGRIEGYRNFCNKLWNASRFVLLNNNLSRVNTKAIVHRPLIFNQWIWHELNQTLEKVHKSLSDYRFDLFAQAIYEFIWNEYCDWYLELAKTVLNDEGIDTEIKRNTQMTLMLVLENILRMTHPIMPFITEEIWQKVAPNCGVSGETISQTPYPVFKNEFQNKNASDDITWLKLVVNGIRKIKSETGIPPKQKVDIILKGDRDCDRDRLSRLKDFIKKIERLNSLQFLRKRDYSAPCSVHVIDNIEIMMPLEGLINSEIEISRQKRRLEKLQNNLNYLSLKLNNKNFITKAPGELIIRERERMSEVKRQIEKINQWITLLSKN